MVLTQPSLFVRLHVVIFRATCQRLLLQRLQRYILSIRRWRSRKVSSSMSRYASGSYMRICCRSFPEVLCSITVQCLSSHLPLVLHYDQAAHDDDYEEVEDGVPDDCAPYSCPCETDAGVCESKSDAKGASNSVAFHQRGGNALALEHHVTDQTKGPC